MNVQTVSFKSKTAAKDFSRSLKQTGFAVVKDHPIPHNLIFETYKDWAQFFKSDEKHQFSFKPKDQSGYFPFRSENAKDSSIKDLKEFFHMYPKTELPALVASRSRELYQQMTGLAAELLGWIDDETPPDVKQKFSMPLREMIQNSEQILFRILHYPPLTGAEEQGAIRAAAHEDINLITLLPAATAPGLQVKGSDGQWYDVACDAGSIVVNAGDMLQEASGGYYVSTTHQVVNPLGEAARASRYSMPLFLHPRPNVRLSDRHTAESYLTQRLREIGLMG